MWSVAGIGCEGGGEACGSPKGAKKRDGLDVEVVGRHVEVQKKQVCTWEQPPRAGVRSHR